jgi:hypothetical protein
MNYHSLHDISQLIVKTFDSASLVTSEGKLIASNDQGALISTTSRLVIFQIVKKYLRPQLGDMIIVNDPENGGLDFRHVFIVTRLTEQLSLVFVLKTPYIDFKIPPTPLYEKGARNTLIWSLLVEPNPNKDQLAAFFESALSKIKSVQNLKKELSQIGDPKNQILLFKVIQEIFEKKFNNQALGHVENIFKMSPQEQIKMKLSINEKLTTKEIIMDFSQTSLATTMSAPSHVIESMLIYKLASYYKMSTLVSQPFLDQIRMSLPPKSIVSKATPTGIHNLYMQKLTGELLTFLFDNLSSKNSKKKPTLDLPTKIKLDLSVDGQHFEIIADNKKFQFENLDRLIQSKKLIPLSLNYLDNKVQLKFRVGTVQKVSLLPTLQLGAVPENFLLFKGEPVKKIEPMNLLEGDEFEMNWKVK